MGGNGRPHNFLILVDDSLSLFLSLHTFQCALVSIELQELLDVLVNLLVVFVRHSNY